MKVPVSPDAPHLYFVYTVATWIRGLLEAISKKLALAALFQFSQFDQKFLLGLQ